MCKECGKNPVYEFTNKRKLCRGCFIEYFRKKSLYAIRKFHMIRNGDIIGYYDKKDFRSIVLKDILNLVKKRAFVEITKLPSKKASKIALASSLDSEAQEITNELLGEKIDELKLMPVEEKIIKPLYLFLDEEILLYAKLANLKFKEEKGKEDKISLFIDSLEGKHPEIKRAIVNSWLKIYNKV